MKRNQLQLQTAKTLNSKEMKQVKGGIGFALYECVIGYECYGSLAECRAECPRATGCRTVRACR